ncbi:MAG: DedA family protein [SAR202 cluster bacterium]|nr:MAG: DedA family protein [SAR202 cluster bacterium]
MEYFDGLTTWFAAFAGSEWAVVVLAIATFLESIFSPIPPDPLLIPMSVLNPNMAILYGLVATLSSVLGALVGHWLGSRFGRPILSRFASNSKIDRFGRPVLSRFASNSKIDQAESLFDRFGGWAVLAAAVTPIPYKVFAVLAGVLKYDRKKFFIVSLIGRGVRFIGLGVLLFLFGEQIQIFIEDNLQSLSLYGLAVFMVLGVGLVVLLKFRNRFGLS